LPVLNRGSPGQPTRGGIYRWASQKEVIEADRERVVIGII
jgi:hypothetical protein